MQARQGGCAMVIGKYGSDDLFVYELGQAAVVEHGPFRIRLVQPTGKVQQVEVVVGDVSVFGYTFPGTAFSLTVRGEPWVVLSHHYQGTLDECRAECLRDWSAVSQSCHFV